MKTTAAVLTQLGQALQLMDLDVPSLRSGQVLVDIRFSGVCRTQILEQGGYRGPDPYVPHCLGHEASGTVLEVGPEVSKVKSGDRVILSWIAGDGATVGGTSYSSQGTTINAGPVTTFSRHAVVSESRVTRLSDGVGMKEAALLGCAVPTGLGSVLNTAQVKPGMSLAVFGVGGVGLCAVAGASIESCNPIIALDLHDSRLQAAKLMGATHTVNVSDSDPLEAIEAICTKGVDVAIEASGRTETMVSALGAVRSRGGAAVIIGNARAGEECRLDPKQFNLGKRLLGTWGGDCHPDTDYPLFCEMLLSGKLDLSPLISNLYSLAEVNSALEDMGTGKTMRPLIDMRLGS